jgi:hypothetical protein
MVLISLTLDVKRRHGYKGEHIFITFFVTFVYFLLPWLQVVLLSVWDMGRILLVGVVAGDSKTCTALSALLCFSICFIFI